MPGSSLWLIPPEHSPLYQAVHSLIVDQIPPLFPSTTPPPFPPHITLTSEVSLPEHSDAQKWLDTLTVPDDVSGLKLSIRAVEVGRVFFQKVTMRCDKTPELAALAASCRAAGVKDVNRAKAEAWAEREYSPHCSLVYSTLAPEAVQSKLTQLNSKVQAAKQQHPDSMTAEGAAIWLVPTHRDIAEWKPIAARSLPETKWSWET